MTVPVSLFTHRFVGWREPHGRHMQRCQVLHRGQQLDLVCIRFQNDGEVHEVPRVLLERLEDADA